MERSGIVIRLNVHIPVEAGHHSVLKPDTIPVIPDTHSKRK